MSNLNHPSGKKRKRSSEHSDRDLELQLGHSVKPSDPRSPNELTVPLRPTAPLEPPTANQEADQVSHVKAWVSDPQQLIHEVHQSSEFSEPATDLEPGRLSLFSDVRSNAAPLTIKNLHLLHQQTMSANSGKPSDPKTPSKSPSKLSSTSGSNSYIGACKLLALNGMHIEKSTVMNKYPKVKDAIECLLVDRDSEKKRDTALLLATIEAYGNSNEKTLQSNVMALLKGIDRSVTQQTYNGEPKTELRAWLYDHLAENLDHPFASGAVPVLEPGTAFEKRVFESLLKEYPKIKNPRPDILYGLWDAAFSSEENAVNSEFEAFSSYSEPLLHPAFVWEWKGAKGSMAEATMQACRAAAAMGHALREFQKAIGTDLEDNLVDGADMTSLVYALCIDERNAMMHVGFYAQEGDSMIFRLIPVRQYAFLNEKDLRNLRQDVHSVLDWIVGKRLQWLKEIMSEYIAPEIVNIGQADSSSRSPAMKKRCTGNIGGDLIDEDELA